jgi:CRP/FNR family transcriptional regulator/CRP/FNR family cyclic AMP-dependent transcriptional regulator
MEETMTLLTSVPPTSPPRRAAIVRLGQPAYNSPCHPPLLPDRPVPDRLTALKQASFFAELTEPELSTLAQDLIAREFQQGELIFNQGDQGRVLYLIAEGRVRIFVQGEEGQEKSVILYGPGDVFGDLSAIDERPRSASALAVTDTTLLMLSRENLHKHLRKIPQLALNFIKVLSVRLRYSTEQVYDLSFLDVPGRLARRLLELAERHGVVEPSGGTRINFPLNQSDLAYLVGTTRESINKTMGSFRRQNFIRTQQNYVIILDTNGLQRISL